MRFTTLLMAFILAAPFFAGCGANSNPFGTVYLEGVVTVDGQPMQGISVSLLPRNGDLAAGGITDDKGKFTVETGGAPVGSGAKPGEYDIVFRKSRTEGANMSMEETTALYGPGELPMTYLIPQRYSSPATSGIAPITVSDKKAENKFKFELTSEE
ncbi:MAG: carboxypeptidase-like regulatory domain-containing protein [Planctomycetaceae bacterium]|jgi:hypothetical protein|nr:carboxypeptidase-like regulatory domain-containing protein [Planctomycetaceae bacterium]